MAVLTTFGEAGQPVIHHVPGMTLDTRLRQHGRGRHSEVGPLIAGGYTTIRFEFEIGEQPVKAGGRLIIAWRWPYDWGDLQSDDPAADGHVVVESPLPGTPIAAYHWFGGPEPWHHYLEVVAGEELAPGTLISVTCGDRSGGSRGWRAPTSRLRAADFLMLIEHEPGQGWIRLPDPPPFTIDSGPAERLVLTAASDAVLGEPFGVTVRGEDRWGNVTPLPSAPQLTAHMVDQPDASPGVTIEPRTVHFGAEPVASPGEAVCHYEVIAADAGDLYFSAECEGVPTAGESNPVRIATTSAGERTIHWGDLHAGQTINGCGAGTLEEFYSFARDCSDISFLSEQANDHYVTDEVWNSIRETTRDFYEPGRFVPFLGCEWSALTPDGGDRNVFYRFDEPRLRRSDRFFSQDVPDPEPDKKTAPEFLEAIRDEDVLINMHVGGRMTNLQWHEPKVEKLLELHSTHGTIEWFALDALQRGYRPAFTAGSDGVTGRPAASHPGERLIRNLPGGLTAVMAEELTYESLWDALHQRRTWATTGVRIRLGVEVNGLPMGADCRTDGPVNIEVKVVGTAAIERVDLFRGTEIIASREPALAADSDRTKEAGSSAAGVHRVRLLWGGTAAKGTARAQRMLWTGRLEIPGGEIEIVERVGFFAPCDTTEVTSPGVLEWSTATAGNTTGLILNVRADGETECEVATSHTAGTASLNEILADGWQCDAGGVGGLVSLGKAPAADALRTFRTSFTDEAAVGGVTPYWVRVIQVDQHRAWSSPVYVTRTS